MKLTIDGVEYEVPIIVFRRILTAAYGELEKLRVMEGSAFPSVDKSALDLYYRLTAKHTILI